MKLLQVFFLTLFMILLFDFADAQSSGGKISGVVLDYAKKALDGATVVLLAAKDSAVISNQFAKPDGSFTFQNLKDNVYIVKATYIGYKDYTSGHVVIREQKAVNLPAFILSTAGKTLNEVAVTAQKSYVQEKIDR